MAFTSSAVAVTGSSPPPTAPPFFNTPACAAEGGNVLVRVGGGGGGGGFDARGRARERVGVVESVRVRQVDWQSYGVVVVVVKSHSRPTTAHITAHTQSNPTDTLTNRGL